MALTPVFTGLEEEKETKKERRRGRVFWKYIYMNCRWQQDSYFYE